MNLPRVEIILKMLILLLIASCLSGCQSKVIQDPDTCKINIPPGWKTQKNIDGIFLTAISPFEDKDDMFQENFNIVVEKIPSTMSVDKYYELNMKTLKRDFPTFLHNESGETTISGKNARWATYFLFANNTKLKAIVYLVTNNNLGYAIIFMATAESYSDYTTRFEAAIESFRFI